MAAWVSRHESEIIEFVLETDEAHKALGKGQKTKNSDLHPWLRLLQDENVKFTLLLCQYYLKRVLIFLKDSNASELVSEHSRHVEDMTSRLKDLIQSPSHIQAKEIPWKDFTERPSRKDRRSHNVYDSSQLADSYCTIHRIMNYRELSEIQVELVVECSKAMKAKQQKWDFGKQDGFPSVKRVLGTTRVIENGFAYVTKMICKNKRARPIVMTSIQRLRLFKYFKLHEYFSNSEVELFYKDARRRIETAIPYMVNRTRNLSKKPNWFTGRRRGTNFRRVTTVPATTTQRATRSGTTFAAKQPSHPSQPKVSKKSKTTGSKRRRRSSSSTVLKLKSPPTKKRKFEIQSFVDVLKCRSLTPKEIADTHNGKCLMNFVGERGLNAGGSNKLFRAGAISFYLKQILKGDAPGSILDCKKEEYTERTQMRHDLIAADIELLKEYINLSVI